MTSEVNIFEFPFLYPSRNEIEYMKWQKKMRLKNEFKEKVGMYLKTQKWKSLIGKVHIRINLFFASNREIKRDIDNWQPKWLLDCLVKAKVIADDNSEIIPEGVEIHFYDKAKARNMVVMMHEI